eukprot:1027167-Pelagomonas_calceolata.AAC.8
MMLEWLWAMRCSQERPPPQPPPDSPSYTQHENSHMEQWHGAPTAARSSSMEQWQQWQQGGQQ